MKGRIVLVALFGALLTASTTHAADDVWRPLVGWDFKGTGKAKLSSSVGAKAAIGHALVDLAPDGCVRFDGKSNQQLVMKAPAPGVGECANANWALSIEFRLNGDATGQQVIADGYATPPKPPTYGKRLSIKAYKDEVRAASFFADGTEVAKGSVPRVKDDWQALTVTWTVEGRQGTWALYDGATPEGGKLIATAQAALEAPTDKVVFRFGSNCAGNRPLTGDIRKIVFYRKAGKAARVGARKTPAKAGEKWALQFEDDFGRAELGPDWKVLDGEWRVENGKLTGRGMILCTRRFPGAQRITYDATTNGQAPCDLSAFLSATDKGVFEGAFFGFGSNRNAKSKLLLLKKEVATSPRTITPGKTHRVAAERDGLTLRQTVDGAESFTFVNGGEPTLQEAREGAMLVRDMVDLSGEDHEYVGLYIYTSGAIDNVKVYTKPDAAAGLKTAGAGKVVGKRMNAIGEEVTFQERSFDEGANNAISNPGFERLEMGVRTQPADWVELRWTREDSIAVVTDPEGAHWGRRYLRLSAPGEKAIHVHNIPEGGIKLTPGTRYDVSVWARALDGADATLSIEPGHGQATLSPEWKEYRFTYEHPSDAKPELGCFVAIRGGPAAVDDVSISPVGRAWDVPPEWQADGSGLADADATDGWLPADKGGAWAVRVPIVLSEVMGQDAANYLVALRLGDVFPSFGYLFLALDSVAVVDGATGERADWAIVNADRDESFSGGDHLVFRASCPARARATYYAYFRDPAAKLPPFKLSSKIPTEFADPGAYPYRLYCDIGKPERPLEGVCRVSEGRLELRVCDRAGRGVSTTLVSPSGKAVRGPVLARDETDPQCWVAAKDAPVTLDEQGVWEVRLRGGSDEIGIPFVNGSCLWAGGNVRRINRSDGPSYGADRGARIAAAKGEREALQVVVDSVPGLGAVDLSVTDLTDDKGATIASDAVKVARVEEILITKPQLGAPAGWYADVILPWRDVEVGPNARRVAWITVTVPREAAAGTYRGQVVAETEDGGTLSLPIELKVFDFTFPERPAFTPVLGADLWATQSWYPRTPKVTNPGEASAYLPFDRDAVIEYGLHLARNFCTPFYYYQWTCPYPTPWHYDPKTKTATFDFSIFDREAPRLLAAGAKYLFVGDHINCGWRKVARITDWKNDQLVWRTWKSRPYNHEYRVDLPEGLDMLRAWGRGMAAHLKDKGLLESSYVYVADELKSDEARAATDKVAAALAGLPTPLQSFAANYMTRWLPLLDHVTAMSSSGEATEACLARFEKRGGQYWGTYNRSNLPSYPLSIPRIIGPQSYTYDVSHYFQWASWRIGYGWLNAHAYRFVGENAGYPHFTFVKDVLRNYGLGTLNYCWPEGEPLPEGKTRAFASSVRFAALRESVEDYEYVKVLSEIVARHGADSSVGKRAQDLLDRMKALIARSVVKRGSKSIATHAVFDIDEAAYDALRREMGRAIAEDARSRN